MVGYWLTHLCSGDIYVPLAVQYLLGINPLETHTEGFRGRLCKCGLSRAPSSVSKFCLDCGEAPCDERGVVFSTTGKTWIGRILSPLENFRAWTHDI